MKALQIKIICLGISFFFVQAMLLSSVCVSTKNCSGTKEKVLLSLDVCGHSGHSVILDGANFVAAIPSVPQICMIGKTGFPPTPGEAVASVEPGEIDDPPKS